MVSCRDEGDEIGVRADELNKCVCVYRKLRGVKNNLHLLLFHTELRSNYAISFSPWFEARHETQGQLTRPMQCYACLEYVAHGLVKGADGIAS